MFSMEQVGSLAVATRCNAFVRLLVNAIYRIKCFANWSRFIPFKIRVAIPVRAHFCTRLVVLPTTIVVGGRPNRSVNIGLELIHNKHHLKVHEFSDMVDGEWFFSAKAVDVIRQFLERFPPLKPLLSKRMKKVPKSKWIFSR